jgi:hypothetical protein
LSRRTIRVRHYSVLSIFLALQCGPELDLRIAHAHAVPAGLSLHWSDAASPGPWVLTNRGVVFTGLSSSELAGEPRLRCNEAFSINTSARPHLWRDGDTLALITAHAILRTTDGGCTLTSATGLPELRFDGFAVLPDALSTMLVSTGLPDMQGGVFASLDGGRSFTRRHAAPPDHALTALIVSAGEPSRVYASGYRRLPGENAIGHVWAVSRDGGHTFSYLALPQQLTALGVSTADPDVVFAQHELSANQGKVEIEVLRSVDAGATFQSILVLSGRPAFATLETTVWLGAAETAGLHVSHNDGISFHTALPELSAVTCLQARAGRIYACAQGSRLQAGVWSASVNGDDLQSELLFSQIQEGVSCSHDDQCSASWADWRQEVLQVVSRPPDAGAGANGIEASPASNGYVPPAGAADTEANASPSRDEDRKSSGGCRLTSTHPEGEMPALMVVLWWCMRRRRR